MKKIIILFAIISTIACFSPLFAQTTTIGNTSSVSADFLGWKSTVSFELNVNHKGPESMRFGTNNIERMRLTSSGVFWLGAPSTFDAIANVYGALTGEMTNYAVRIKAANGAERTGLFIADNGSSVNAGVRGKCYGSTGVNYGLYGEVCGTLPASRNFAIHGNIDPQCTGTSYAGYFEGKTYTPGHMWTLSDASFKTNIQDLADCTVMLTALAPKSYRFKEEFSHMSLPTGLQYGLLAQELETVVPHAVRSIVNPAEYDDEDNLLHGSVEFDGVNYSQLIPVLIGAFQERQELLDQQEATIAQLEERVSQAEAKAFILSQSE